MGDRCYMELVCRDQDMSKFEALDFVDEDQPDNFPGCVLMVDDQANYGHYDEMPTDVVYFGTAGAGADYGACEFACDGKTVHTVDTDDHGRYAVAFDGQGNPDQKDIERVRECILFRNKVIAELQQEVVTTGSEVANVS